MQVLQGTVVEPLRVPCLRVEEKSVAFELWVAEAIAMILVREGIGIDNMRLR